MMETQDTVTRRLERDVASGDSRARLALASAYARSGRADDAALTLDLALQDDPLSAAALAIQDELGLPPLSRTSPWPTVAGGNDRARKSTARGARQGKVIARIRVGAAPMQRGNGEVERALSITCGGDGAVYVATDQRRLIAIDLASRATRWVREFEHAFAAPSVGSGERLALASGDTVRLIDGRSGETLWIARSSGVSDDDIPGQATFARRGLVLAPGLRGVLNAFDAASGKVRWRFASRGAQYNAPAIRGDVIYQSCSLGGVYAIDHEGALISESRVQPIYWPSDTVSKSDDLLHVDSTVQRRTFSVQSTNEGQLAPNGSLSKESYTSVSSAPSRMDIGGIAWDSEDWVFFRASSELEIFDPGQRTRRAHIALESDAGRVPVAIANETTIVGTASGMLYVVA